MSKKVAPEEEVSHQSSVPPGSPAPTLLNVTAFARFEFEPGRGNEGTKILMVEWQDEDEKRSFGSWQCSWSGKTTVLPADEKTSDNTRRLYFLLPPTTTVPAHVSLSYQPASEKSSLKPEPQTITVLTLPAIYPPELGASSKASGKKGVLHTIWAKRRLQVLEKEIMAEQELNIEGIALEMALSEKDWIESTFGLKQKAPTLDLSALPKYAGGPLSPSLQSPRTPGGRRLSEKLKGLSIGTSDKDLASKGVNTPIREAHPLSPETSDVAYSSFNSSFRNGPASPKVKANARTITSQGPPEHILKQQQQSSSLPLGYVSQQQNGGDVEEDLFAIALSPRSPDISKSPFSFSSEEVAPYAKLLKRDRPPGSS